MLTDLHRIAGPALLVLLAVASVQARGGVAAVLRSGMPGENTDLVGAICGEIGRSGYSVTEIGFDALCDASALTPQRFDLLVLPDAGALPARAMPVIDGYLKGGGDIIALNAPMWRRALVKAGGRWLTREEYQRETAPVRPDSVIFDFSSTGTTGWQRSGNDTTIQSSWRTEDAGPGPGQCSLHVSVSKLTGWDTLHHDTATAPFAEGKTLTVFSAKGGPNTSQLAVEWTEKDGSRWIAVIPLTTEWRRYVLTPQDFRFWHSNPTRGFAGDRFKPENADRFSVGLAFTHTASVGPGPHEYWIGPIGTAKPTPELREVLETSDPPKLDMLSPSYKLFDCRDVAALLVRADQVIVDRAELPPARIIRSVQPRPTGGGFDKGRAWRFIPLVEARSPKGDWRGVPAAVMVHAAGPYKGGVWASFGIDDADWYASPIVLRMIGQIARRMRDPVFLVDGGAAFYTYFPRQEVRLGVCAANLGTSSADLKAGVVVSRGDRPTIAAHSWKIALGSGETRAVSDVARVNWSADGLTVTANLLRGEKIIDRVVHRIYLWQPKKKRSYVTVENGEFRLDGRRWRPHGVNYMPSSGIGTEDGEYFEHWLGAKSYDPEVVQRDLEHIKDLGFNSVSIFIYSRSTEAQNLLDLLRRLDELGLKANLSLRPGTPMNFLWPEIRKIIEYYRLWENDTVFAYDLAWEPMFNAHEDRKIWDRDWESWIIERYGSVENAEKDWGFKVPRDDSGKITNPLPHQIDTDGDWRVMVAAYRRFLDTLLYKKYSEARRLVRSVDPHHLVSFRMAEVANPTYRWGGRIPYDFPYLAAAVDFLAPEAYGRMGDWNHIKPGWFEREYARWAAPTKPMIWAEAGVSTWDTSRMANSTERLAYAAEVYRNFYRLLIDSASDGVFFWWYPGGFRFGENSDYGIIEPDGTDREVTKVIREYGPRFINGPSLKPVNHRITIDRDKHPDGVAGIYDEVKDEFWNAIDSGRVPGLRTVGTGTESCSSPDLAVGNTKPNGSNPLKFLDGAFDVVEVLDADGRWTRVENGGSVKVDGGKPVRGRVAVTNLGESAWSAEAGCRVFVICRHKEDTVCNDIPGTIDHLGSAVADVTLVAGSGLQESTEITLTFYAEARRDYNLGQFGERFSLRLLP